MSLNNLDQEFVIQSYKNIDELEFRLNSLLPLVNLLYPHHKYDYDSFKLMLCKLMSEGGFELSVVIHTPTDSVSAFGGFFIKKSLSWGKYLYFADFVVDLNYRRKGLLKLYYDFLESTAKAESCESIHLDVRYERSDSIKSHVKSGALLFGHHLVFKHFKPEDLAGVRF